MPKSKNGNLTIQDRIFIEESIAARRSMSDTARRIGVAPSTVIREIKRNLVTKSDKYLAVVRENFCSRKDACGKYDICKKGCLVQCSKCKDLLCNSLCPDFLPKRCQLLDKAPYCCNRCNKRYGFGCGHQCLFYDAGLAHERATQRKVESRMGIDCTKEELEAAAKTIKDGLDSGRSLEDIWSRHGDELPFGIRTCYNYARMGLLDGITMMSFPKAVRFNPRKKEKKNAYIRKNLDGHLYSDYVALPEEERIRAVQMDCVIGKQGEAPAILTLTMPRFSFQILMLLEKKDQEHVRDALNSLQGLCGDEFETWFGIILTDRGTEFLAPELIEYGKNGSKRCSVYYCDPMRSNQKPHCERLHAELRRIIPKGTSLLKFKERDIAIVASHLNSYGRPQFGGVAPLKLMGELLPNDLIDGLGMELVDPDEVMMNPKLIAHVLER